VTHIIRTIGFLVLAANYITLLPQVVTIYFPDFDAAKGKQITAAVFGPGYPGMSGVNIEQLQAGLAKYKEAGASLDWYQACYFKRAEKEARDAKRGLWEKASN